MSIEKFLDSMLKIPNARLFARLTTPLSPLNGGDQIHIMGQRSSYLWMTGQETFTDGFTERAFLAKARYLL
jgi:hypothetical protein